jgi:hypothetical protein
MNLWRRAILSLPLCAVIPAHASRSGDEINSLLDAFHRAAANAKFDEYFGLFAPDGVFIGTDASERWTVDEFKAYAKRHVNVSGDDRHASFDELLDNAALGRCRGTGVLRRVGGAWKIEQYHLTIPVPNALADEVVKRIRAAK